MHFPFRKYDRFKETNAINAIRLKPKRERLRLDDHHHHHCVTMITVRKTEIKEARNRNKSETNTMILAFE